MTWLLEKICVWDKLPSGTSYCLLSTRCNKYGVFKTEACKTRLHINELMKMWSEAHRNLMPLEKREMQTQTDRGSFPGGSVEQSAAMQEAQKMWVWSLGQEDPLEKEMATPSSTLAWKIPWTEKPGRLQSMGSQRVGHDWPTSLSFFLNTWAER